MSRCWWMLLTLVGAVSVFADGAVISQVSKGVTLRTDRLGGARFAARPLQLMPPGSKLELPERTRAVVICAGDRAVELDGPTSWQLGTAGCGQGRALTAGSYQRLLPADGRMRDFHGSLFSESRSRSDDKGGLVPVLVSPRSPTFRDVAVRNPKPTIEWTDVRGASNYELNLEAGGGTLRASTVSVQQANCRPDRRIQGLRICSAAWPWEPLTAGQVVELHVRALTSGAESSGEVSKLKLVDSGLGRQLDRELGELATKGFPAATLELLRAARLAEAELFNEAASALFAALEEQPQASVAVRLGDLYLGLGLLPGAQTQYSYADRLLGPRSADYEVLAATRLGLGRIYNERKDPAAAKRELEQAARFYRELGWSEEAREVESEASHLQAGG